MKLAAILICVFLMTACGNPPLQIEVEPWTLNQAIEVLEPGDIILKQGLGKVSKIIVETLDEDLPFSHSSIVVRDTTGTLSVIHSVSGSLAEEDGVQKVPLTKMFEDVKEGTLFVLRHKSSAEVRSTIAALAERKLKQRIRFDHDFNASDTTKLYCSEFVQNVLYESFQKNYFRTKSVGPKDVYTFDSILESKDFVVLNKK